MSITRYPEKFTKNDYKIDTPEDRDKKIEALIAAMTVDEKLSLLGGSKEPADKGKIGNAGYQWGVPRLGIPEIVMYDGPAGITGIVDTTGIPQPSLLGCTWDDEMAYTFGAIAASEDAACSGNFLLAPQVDVIRSPHFGRNKDMKSEDSYQAARMGAAETKGAQDNKAVATIKHFAAANVFGSHFPMFPRSIVDEQTLHEVYLRPFERCIHEGDAGSVMNAYNIINEAYMSANSKLLQGVLRDQWGFKGSVMSDWGSVHEFTVNKGMDIEMPYPAYNDRGRIFKNIRRGRYDWDQIDESVRRVLYGMSTIGLLGLVEMDEDGKVKEDPGHTHPIEMTWYYDEAVKAGLLEENAAKAANILREGIVLMKNDNKTLPLAPKTLEGRTVMVGLGAVYPICGEAQERSYGRLDRMVSGQAALEELTGKTLPAYVGIDFVGEAIPTEQLFTDETCTEHGVVRSYGILKEDRDKEFASGGPSGAGAAFQGMVTLDEDGEVVDTGLTSYNDAGEVYPEGYPLGKTACVDSKIDFTCGRDEKGGIVRNYLNGIGGSAFTDGEAYTWKGVLTVPEDGDYTLLLECIGGEGRFFIQIDGEWQVAGRSTMREWTQWPWDTIVCTPEGMGITSRNFTLRKGEKYPILVFGRQGVKNKDLQIRAAWITPAQRKADYDAAMEAVAGADTVVYFAADTYLGKGMMDNFKKVGYIGLAEQQTAMLKDAISRRKPGGRFIVVLQTSNARAIGDWADSVDAILCTYMPGQEGSRVIAEILTGRTNPTGKLTQTWPRRSEDTPLTDTPDHLLRRCEGYLEDGNEIIEMSEGIFTGYRWNDKYGVAPMYPFGHGLSYTSYEYGNLAIEEAGGTFAVSLDVTNTGDRAGDEIVQVYLGKAEVPEYIQMAEKQLAGYERVKGIAPGETRHVRILIDEAMLSYWNPAEVLRTRADGTKDKWVRALGCRKVYVGASSRDIRLEGEICVK